MIIFYNKKTGAVIGVIEGRIHEKDVLEKSWIQPSNIPKEDIVKYVVPFVPIYEEVEEIVHKVILVDKKKQLYKRKTIKKKVKRVKELVPDVSFADLIGDFEKGKKSIYNYKVKINKKDKIKKLVAR